MSPFVWSFCRNSWTHENEHFASLAIRYFVRVPVGSFRSILIMRSRSVPLCFMVFICDVSVRLMNSPFYRYIGNSLTLYALPI